MLESISFVLYFYMMKKFSTPILLMILLSLLSCKDKQDLAKDVAQEATNKTNDMDASTEKANKTILCFGNSLTAGYGINIEDAWPSLLQNRLDSMDLQFQVVNAGLSGETSSGGLNRIDWVLNQQVDIFILELGANDMLRGIDVDNTESNLNKILDRVHVKNPNIPVLIAGMYAPPNMGIDYENKFNKIFPDLAQSHRGALIPFFLEGVAGIDSLNLKDGKHPNPTGQKIVLENVWSQLEPLLNR